MNQWRLFFAAATLTTLCACAGLQGANTPAALPAVAKRPAIQVTDLPCAQVSSTDLVTLRYPGENLYRGGAALPKQEGLACLEVLSDWLKNVPQDRWQVTVSGEAGHGFEPLALAGKRQELLQRFFTRKGVAINNWEWLTVAGAGEQLQLLELKDSP
ncbi:MAG: hypothetical protein OEL80_00010 [Desulfuromonadales bacterium]|jgi:hypothetical protein|nr:hypothetical protein [Desulfuromonadales bacterium]